MYQLQAPDLMRPATKPARQPRPPLKGAADATCDQEELVAVQQRQFAARVAHELRTPLAAMRLRVEEALLYSQDTDPREALAEALTGVERLERVINDLLPLTPAALAHLAAIGVLAPA